MKNGSIFLALLMLATISCKNKTENKTAETDNEHWTYGGEAGPEHWSEIEKQSDCGGMSQSPINILDIEVIESTTLTPIDIQYSSNVKIHDVTNNGHSIQYNFEKGDYIILDNEKYELKQVHFHEASEHTIDGIRYPLEMHMVHTNRNGKIAVLAVLAKEGQSSEPFTFLEAYLPVEEGQTKPVNASFDLNLNFPDNKSYYTYNGSLTTPPCTENVKWFIFKTPITVSYDQVKQLQELMPLNNYRGVQPINDRTVNQFVASQD